MSSKANYKTRYKRSKIKSFNFTWNCELCNYISTSKKQAELHAKISHRVKNYKIETPSKEKLKKLKDNIEEGHCVLCRKSMRLHSKNNGNCP